MLSDANSVFFFFFSRFAQAQAQQKQSYLAGVQDALEKVLEWVEANKNIQTCAAQRQALTNFLHQELDAVESETPEPVPVDLKVRKESRPSLLRRPSRIAQGTDPSVLLLCLFSSNQGPALNNRHRFGHSGPLSSPVKRALLHSRAVGGSQSGSRPAHDSTGAQPMQTNCTEEQMSQLDI